MNIYNVMNNIYIILLSRYYIIIKISKKYLIISINISIIQ